MYHQGNLYISNNTIYNVNVADIFELLIFINSFAKKIISIKISK